MDFEKIVYDVLDLRDVRIKHVEVNEKEVHIYLEGVGEPQCPHCGSQDVEVKDIVHRENIRDRNMMYKLCFLHLTIRVLKCHKCKGEGRERFDFVDPYAHQTKRYKDYVSHLGFEINFSSIGVLEELGEKTVEKILNDFAWENSPTSLNGATRVGIDEFAVRKGHKHFSTIIADLNKSKPLAVLPSRKEEELRRYFCAIPEEERLNVAEVTADMWSPFLTIAEEYFPNARITIDRFHVMKHVNRIVDSIRVKEYKTLYKEQREQVKSIHWIMRKNSTFLTDDEKYKLSLFFSWSNKAKKAYQLKEAFVGIMDKTTDYKRGKYQLESWLAKVEKLKTKKATTFVKTATKLLDKISNYFAYNSTNATLEGIMNKVKMVKRMGFGIPNPYHMAHRIILAFQPKTSLYSTV
jgi:transposase